MVALTSRLQHEANYGDKTLARRKLSRLNIDPRNVAVGWAIDFSAQALREIVIGLGGKMDGLMMQSGFQISVSSEVMAILAVASDLATCVPASPAWWWPTPATAARSPPPTWRWTAP